MHEGEVIVVPGPVVPVYGPEDSRQRIRRRGRDAEGSSGERHPSDGLPGGGLRHPQFVADAGAAAGIPPGGRMRRR